MHILGRIDGLDATGSLRSLELLGYECVCERREGRGGELSCRIDGAVRGVLRVEDGPEFEYFGFRFQEF